MSSFQSTKPSYNLFTEYLLIEINLDAVKSSAS